MYQKCIAVISASLKLTLFKSIIDSIVLWCTSDIFHVFLIE
nr:MAG TPA: hypothetical protein [Caudoviricetes sp.]